MTFEERTKGRTIRHWVGLVAGFLLGAILLVAAWAKYLEPGAFIQQIQLEGLNVVLSAAQVSLLALFLEVALGVALVLGARHRIVLIPSAGLVVFFLFLTGRNYWLVAQGLRDPEAACGCFGSLIERTPAEAFWQDLLMLAPLMLLTWWGASKGLRPLRTARIAASVMVGLLFSWATWRTPDFQFSDVAVTIAASENQAHFRPAPEFQLLLGGERVADALIFSSAGSPRLAALVPAQEIVIIFDPSNQELAVVPAHLLTVLESGEATLRDIPWDTAGTFEIGGEGLKFQVSGQSGVLAPHQP